MMIVTVPSPLHTGLVVLAHASLIAGAALAQTANYTSIEAVPGKPVQLSYHASAHKEHCSPGALPVIRVTEPPQNGFLRVRRAVLTTDKIEGCPQLKVPAQLVFYVAREGYAGPDHLGYNVTSENGEVETYDVTVTVKAAPATNPPAGGTKEEKL
jgi:hypothetical protein